MKQNHPLSAIFPTHILCEKLEIDSKQIFTFAHFYFDCGYSELKSKLRTAPVVIPAFLPSVKKAFSHQSLIGKSIKQILKPKN